MLAAAADNYSGVLLPASRLLHRSETRCCRRLILVSAAGAAHFCRHLVRIPGHVGVQGNVAAALSAKEAAAITDKRHSPCLRHQHSAVSSETSRMTQPSNMTEPPSVYEKANLSEDHTDVESCTDAVLLAPVWRGHCSKFRSYQRLIQHDS